MGGGAATFDPLAIFEEELKGVGGNGKITDADEVAVGGDAWVGIEFCVAFEMLAGTEQGATVSRFGVGLAVSGKV
ncbi:MAG: hypothetical protein GX230_07170 [Lentisphaerae bacterium]|nr:hypothetical protein [Lentisphaerota bacterium]